MDGDALDSFVGGKFGGSGLGLTIGKNLLQLMGSSIQPESQISKGSRFFFSLYLPEAGSQKIKIYENEEWLTTSAYDILFVEDVDYNRIGSQGFFSKWNLNCDTAATGSGVVELATEKQYDLILMDLNPADMTGFKSNFQTRTLKNNYSSIIVGLSACSYEEVKDRIETAGINGFIQKQCAFQPLRSAVIFGLGKEIR